MRSTPVAPALHMDVLALLPRDPVSDNIRALLAEEGFKVVIRPPEDDESWLGGEGIGALLLDEALSPESLDRAVRSGRVAATAPVFVVARRLPPRDRYMAWLEAGAWDIMKMPLEAVALSLRLRSILGARADRPGAGSARAYSWDSLGQVAEEALALSQRYERPLHCVAAEIRPRSPAAADPHALIRRIAGTVHRMTRRSDLIGIADSDTLVVLLPDTGERGAEVFRERLEEVIVERLRSWDIRAEVRAVGVSGESVEGGRELLDRAATSLKTLA